MRLRSAGRRSASILAAGFLLVSASATASKAKFTLEFSGMIAFARTPDDRIDVLLLNQTKNEVTHTPLLELNCDQLQDAAQRNDCQYFWPPSRDTTKTNRVLALDSGFEVRLAVGGAKTDMPVKLDTSFEKGVVPLDQAAKGSTGAAEAVILRKEALASATAYGYVAVRPVLSLKTPTPLGGGVLLATAGKELNWRFRKDPGSGQTYTSPTLAKQAQWNVEYDPAQGVVVELWPIGAKAPAKKLTLKSSGDLQLTLSNEPDDLKFCDHAPKSAAEPMEHFRAFWGLSKLAASSPGDAQKLPLPYSDKPDPACSASVASHSEPEIKGRRVNCMMVLFSSEE